MGSYNTKGIRWLQDDRLKPSPNVLLLGKICIFFLFVLFCSKGNLNVWASENLGQYSQNCPMPDLLPDQMWPPRLSSDHFGSSDVAFLFLPGDVVLNLGTVLCMTPYKVSLKSM